MLFYVKKSFSLEILVALALAATGWLGARALAVPLPARFDGTALAIGAAGAIALTGWTFLVQAGYAAFKGKVYTENLTRALARHFADASAPQIGAAALAAAAEEIFFRGFVQGRWGLAVGALAFMAAHLGSRDIRVVGYWSVFQGLLLGALYVLTRNLVVPAIAHGLFDLGAMLYFRRLMAAEAIA